MYWKSPDRPPEDYVGADLVASAPISRRDNRLIALREQVSIFIHHIDKHNQGRSVRGWRAWRPVNAQQAIASQGIVTQESQTIFVRRAMRQRDLRHLSRISWKAKKTISC